MKKTTVSNFTLSRRGFVLATLSTGSLLFSFPAPSRASRDDVLAGFGGNLGPLIQINPDNSVVIAGPSPEIGTGLHTSIPMLIADELGADWNRVSVEQLALSLKRGEDGEAAWEYLPQGGGGSYTLEKSMGPARKFAAIARRLLIETAAEHWGLPAEELTTVDSFVRHRRSDRAIEFSGLLSDAATRALPDDAALRPDTELRLVGRWTRSKNVMEIVKGDPVFGIDAEYPGMKHAVVLRSPYFDGRPIDIDDSSARAVEGVRDIVVLEPLELNEVHTYLTAGVAVVADTFWAAKKARDLLIVEWDKGLGGDESSEDHEKDFEEFLAQQGEVLVRDGDGADMLAEASKVVDQTYVQPLLSHATMEPQNCIANFRGNTIDIIGPMQNPRNALQAVSRMTGIDPVDMRCLPTRVGGSFGRRLYGDFVCEAVEISRKAGVPIKLTWTREDDMTHDLYRPTSAQRVVAGLDEDGKIIAWHHRLAATTSAFRKPWSNPEGGGEWGDAVWLDNPPRRMVPNYEIDFHLVKSRIPRGAWRAPFPTRNAFVVESFYNELAEVAGVDALEYRLNLLGDARELPYDHWGGPVFDTGRMANCYRNVATEADWGEAMPAGQGRGLAGFFTFGSYCAMVIDAEVDANGEVRPRRVVAAVDCGRVVNPNGVMAQVEGAILDGLSVAIGQQITIVDGKVREQNFDTYKMARLDQMPPVLDVHILPSDNEAKGVGELGIPPVAPALLEAIYQATGKRVRRLPIADQLRF